MLTEDDKKEEEVKADRLYYFTSGASQVCPPDRGVME